LDKETAIIQLLSRSDRLIETATKAGVAYLGYKSNNHWTGALTSLVALKLAQSGNLAAGAAGVGVLAIIGLTDLGTKYVNPLDPTAGGSKPYCYGPWRFSNPECPDYRPP